jgi:hypothetical protein
MSEYPEALLEKVAAAMWDSGRTVYTWPQVADWEQTIYREMAASALDALGLREELRTFEIAKFNKRRYLTDWEDA